MNRNLISVIVPIYNVEKYLGKCITSIINQTYKNLEIILVDDGSTDPSGNICDKYAQEDNRIKVIHKKNGGLVSARKTALNYATGEYCLNVDGDDWIDSDMIGYLSQKMQQGNFDFVQCNFVTEGGKSKETSYQDLSVMIDSECVRNDLLNAWMWGNAVLGSQIFLKLYRTDFFKACYANVPDYMNNGEDFIAFLYVLKKAHSFISVKKAFYHYVIRNDSLSHNRDGICLLMKENKLSIVMYELILSLFPSFSRQLLDTWTLKRCLSQLKNNGCSVPVYKFSDIERLYKKKIVIYGAGAVGQDYYSQLVKYQKINIVSWVDKNPSACNFDYFDVQPVDVISSLDFDYILIAVLKETIADSIKNDLITMGIPKEKIIWHEPSFIF